jgi:hypothetical protein
MKKINKVLSIIGTGLIGGTLVVAPLVATSCGTSETISVTTPLTFDQFKSLLTDDSPDSYLMKGQCLDTYYFGGDSVTSTELIDKMNDTMKMETLFYAVLGMMCSYLIRFSETSSVTGINDITFSVTCYSSNEIKFELKAKVNIAEMPPMDLTLRSKGDKKLKIFKAGVLNFENASGATVLVEGFAFGASEGKNIEEVTNYSSDPSYFSFLISYGGPSGDPYEGSMLKSLFPNFSH